MKRSRVAILFAVLLALALSAGAFAELVVTYTSSDDTWSEYTIQDTPRPFDLHQWFSYTDGVHTAVNDLPRGVHRLARHLHVFGHVGFQQHLQAPLQVKPQANREARTGYYPDGASHQQNNQD